MHLISPSSFYHYQLQLTESLLMICSYGTIQCHMTITWVMGVLTSLVSLHPHLMVVSSSYVYK